jgi:hypothetical protein
MAGKQFGGKGSFSGGPKDNQDYYPRSKKRKDNPKATPNQKKMKSGNTIDSGPSNRFRKLFGVM